MRVARPAGGAAGRSVDGFFVCHPALFASGLVRSPIGKFSGALSNGHHFIVEVLVRRMVAAEPQTTSGVASVLNRFVFNGDPSP
jgi:hypothetical protein